jgi:uncharacterized protein (DUF488 family)
MLTPEFALCVDELVAVASKARTAIMCAEADPARCHRSLVAVALLVRGIAVLHISSASEARLHALSSSARAVGKSVSYPA